jgi:hypothetical protein
MRAASARPPPASGVSSPLRMIAFWTAMQGDHRQILETYKFPFHKMVFLTEAENLVSWSA